MINTNLYLAMFQSYCGLLVKFLLSTAYRALFNALVRGAGEPLNPRLQNLASMS